MDTIETDPGSQVDPVEPDTDIDATLTVGLTETGIYGNGFDDLLDPDGLVTFQFEATGRSLAVEFAVLDSLASQEIAIYLNGVQVGLAPRGGNNVWVEGSLLIDMSLVIDGTNTLTFQQLINPDFTWGVTDILVTALPVLDENIYQFDNFGNKYDGAVDPDGILTFTFIGPATGLTLHVQGYDIDRATEVEVFVNGISHGFLSITANNGMGHSSFEISADLILDDQANTVTFVQTLNASRAWGVSQILLLGEAPHLLPLNIDPEFTTDGYVAWQDASGFHIGMMDLDTGGYLGTLNTAAIAPTPISDTWQGPEIITTATGGVGAIGMTPNGLAYVSLTEGRLLEGTEGMRIAFMPKGEVDRLRFVMLDAAGGYHVWDDGQVTALDLDGGRMVQWLNADEFMVIHDGEAPGLALYNVETGASTWITDNAYIVGHQAAMTSATGDEFLAVNAGAHHDIWVNRGNGWTFLNRLSSPLDAGANLYSAELFEWQGSVFLSGYVSGGSSTGESAIVVYDIENDLWSQISEIGLYYDPETLVLNNGDLACYFTSLVDRAEYFYTLSAETAAEVAVPSPAESGLGLPETAVSLTVAPASVGALLAATPDPLAASGFVLSGSAAAADPVPEPDGGDSFVFRFPAAPAVAKPGVRSEAFAAGPEAAIATVPGRAPP